MKKIYRNNKVRIIFQDKRFIEGNLLKCDIHMNVLVLNSVEYRTNKKSQKWEKRAIGICVIRGNSIATISLL